jgi:hypothetical protein
LHVLFKREKGKEKDEERLQAKRREKTKKRK